MIVLYFLKCSLFDQIKTDILLFSVSYKIFDIFLHDNNIFLTIVVSAMDPKLLIKMLHVTFTGGPVKKCKKNISVMSGQVGHNDQTNKTALFKV